MSKSRKTPGPKARWAPGSKFKNRCRAEVAASLIVQYRKRHGHPTAGDLVALARPASSPLHRMFEWNDREAARLHRLETARLIMRTLIITSEHGPVRMYQAVRIGMGVGSGGKVYVPTEEALTTPGLSEQVLDGALRELRGWRERWRVYRQIAGLVTDVERVEKKHAKRRPEAAPVK